MWQVGEEKKEKNKKKKQRIVIKLNMG